MNGRKKNRMVLDASKTKSLLVTGKRLKSKLSDGNLDTTINGSEIEQVFAQK